MNNVRVGTGLKAGFGVAEIGLSSMELMVQVYLLELYLAAGLNPLWAGVALAIAVLWDAVSDPLMGSISDRTRARSARGKRLPYFLAGTAVCGFAFWALFSPEVGTEQGWLFLRLLGWYLVLNTALTLVGVPYLALINDLATRSEDRAGFFGWRLVFSGAGLILGLGAPALVEWWGGVEVAASEGVEGLVANRSESSVWIAGAGCLFCLATAFAVWKPAGRAVAEKSSATKLKFSQVVGIAWRSRPFWFVVGAFVLISLGRAVNASLALLFYKGTLRLDDGQVAGALIALSLTVMVATPLWVLLAKRYRKESLCLIGVVSLTALTAVVYPLMPVGKVGPAFFIAISGGMVAASVVLLESLFSDVIERDSAESGLPLSASYYGFWRMATKVARALGLAVSGLFLAWVGFEKGVAEQSFFVDRAVAWAFGPGVALFFAAGAWFVWKGGKVSS